MTFETPQVNVNGYYSKGVYHTRECCRVRGRTTDATSQQLETLRECDVCQNGCSTNPPAGVECPFCGEFVKTLPGHLPCEESQ